MKSGESTNRIEYDMNQSFQVYIDAYKRCSLTNSSKRRIIHQCSPVKFYDVHLKNRIDRSRYKKKTSTVFFSSLNTVDKILSIHVTNSKNPQTILKRPKYSAHARVSCSLKRTRRNAVILWYFVISL